MAYLPPARRISREEARTFPCPTCGARPGAHCVYGDEQRDSNHIARVELALCPVASQIEAAMATPQRQFTVEQGPKRRPSVVPEGVSPATPEETLTVPCPQCEVAAHEPCVGQPRRDGTSKALSSHHSLRWRLAMAMLGRPVLPRNG